MKKIFSLLLVVAMLFSFTVIPVNAVVNDAVVKIWAVPTKGKYNSGDIVTFEVWQETDSGNLGGTGAGVYDFGYDSYVFEPIIDITNKVADFASAGLIYKGYAFDRPSDPLVRDDATSVKKGLPIKQQEDKDKGWDTSIELSIGPKTGKFIDCSTAKKVFSFQLRLKTTSQYTVLGDGSKHFNNFGVGITKTAVENGKQLVAEQVGDIQYDDASGYGFSTSKTWERPVVEVPHNVFHLASETGVRWMPGTSDKSKVQLGIVGWFSAEDINFNITGGKTDLQNVGAEVTIGGTTLAGTTNVIYDKAVNEFKFRALVDNVAVADLTQKEHALADVVFYVTTTDGTKYKSAKTTIDISAEYAEAAAKPEFGA